MFCEQIGTQIFEVSHKRIDHPTQSVYFNHIHNHCELLLFISGQTNYNIDGQIFSPSPPTMSCSFQLQHIGLRKYIIQKKIYAAHMDLSQSLHPTEVYNKYAFSDYSVFYRLYRKAFGVSPKKSIASVIRRYI